MIMSYKKLFFLIFIMLLMKCSLASAVDMQYNQSGAPHIENGGTPSGDYNDLNAIDGLTYDIPELLNGNYYVEIWHNSSQIGEGNLTSINTTINFTTNVSDDYSLQIYNWLSSEWENCNSGSISADTPTVLWCNITDNAMNYNSTDMIVRIKINSTPDSDVGLLQEEYIQYYVSYLSHLQVNLTNPDTTATLNVVQNLTFDMNSTVTCMDGPCGEVFGKIMYNESSQYPDALISTSEGGVPFFIQESPANNIKSCGTMLSGEICNLNWTVNASGGIDSEWKSGVVFNSSYSDIQENSTENATVYILNCTVDFTVHWSSISFGLLDPNTGPWEASGNSDNEYNISVNPGSCNLDFYINSTNITNATLGYEIDVSNLKWSNTSNLIAESFNMSIKPAVLKINLTKVENLTSWYWLNVPPVYTGYYSGK